MQVCSNMADRIQAAKVSIRKRAQLVVLDVEKRRSDRLMDPGSLKVDGVKKIVVSHTDDKGKKNTTTIIFWSQEHRQEWDIGRHSPLTHWKEAKNTKNHTKSSQQRKERGGLSVRQRKFWQVVLTRSSFARWE